MTHSVLASLWRKIHGIGITNPKEMTSLLRDLDTRLKNMEQAYEELAADRSQSDREAGASLPNVDESDDGGREGSKPRTKGGAPRRGK